MPIPDSIARISGPARDTGAFRPIILNDPRRIVIVARGYLDIFAVRSSSDLPLHRSPFITRVVAGQAAIDGPALASAESDQDSFSFLAVPSRDATIMETERSKFNAEGVLSIGTVALIDGWISGLSEFLSRNQLLPPRDLQLLEADPNVPYPAGLAVGAHHSDVIWVSADQPTHFIGNREFAVGAGTLLPLSEWTWLHLTADTEVSAVHTPALLGTDRLWPALDRFSALLLRSAQLVDEKDITATLERNRISRKDREAVTSTIFRSIGGVLNTAPDDEITAPTADRAPLFAAANLVAKSVGGALNASRNSDKANQTADARTLASWARLSGMRMREITLADNWSKRHGPSFVGHSSDGARPLAVLSNGRGSYRAIDPAAGRAWAVDRKAAEGIERRAFMLYAPLPDHVKTGLAALLHILRRRG